MGGSRYRPQRHERGKSLALELQISVESPDRCEQEDLVRRNAHSSGEHRHARPRGRQRDADQFLPLPGPAAQSQVYCVAADARQFVSRARGLRTHEAGKVMPREAARSLRISQVGLRGVVGSGMTAAHVLDFASAFGTFLEAGRGVVVARDPRASGVMIREGVIAALLACGRNVIDLGIAPTPVVQQTIRRLDAAGGVSIGASHNASDWNALKFFGRGGIYLSTAEADELLDIYHLKKFDFVEWDKLGTLRKEPGAVDPYLDELASAFDFGALKRFRVVVDCCNGTSSMILQRMNERFAFQFILINAKMEGVSFANEP